MRLFKRKPVGQLWVHYNQIGGYWEIRVTDGGMVIGGGRYPTEFEAIEAAEIDFDQYFPGIPVPAPRVFRTGTDYYAAVIENERRRK